MPRSVPDGLGGWAGPILCGLLPTVDLVMTARAQGDEIHFSIVTEMAPRVAVVNLKVCTTAAVLAPPPIPLENLAPQFSIGSWAELEPRPLGTRSIHEAVRICSRNSTF